MITQEEYDSLKPGDIVQLGNFRVIDRNTRYVLLAMGEDVEGVCYQRESVAAIVSRAKPPPTLAEAARALLMATEDPSVGPRVSLAIAALREALEREYKNAS